MDSVARIFILVKELDLCAMPTGFQERLKIDHVARHFRRKPIPHKVSCLFDLRQSIIRAEGRGTEGDNALRSEFNSVAYSCEAAFAVADRAQAFYLKSIQPVSQGCDCARVILAQRLYAQQVAQALEILEVERSDGQSGEVAIEYRQWH